MTQRLAWLFIFTLLATPCAFADPFLQPQILPPDLRELNFESQETGENIPVRLDENHLPVKDDFFAEGTVIPFYIEGFLIDSSSGNQIHAWQIVPKENANGVFLLYLHGNGGNILSNLGGGIALMKQGFSVTIVDYSGYGYSGGEATRDNVLLDGQSALDHFAPIAKANNQKFVLYGQSLGGHLAVVLGEKNQDLVDAIAIEGAFTSHKDIAAHFKGAFSKIFVSEPYSAIDRIGQYRKPILVIHSTDDEVVPFSMGQELFEAANAPRDFMEIDQPHLAGLDLYADTIAEKILQLLQ